ncbi:MAG: hypothetical protein HY568_01050 [Candidatus Latescibacteria bacterium]|nr:hypothetical protein [Candidatus Latescibacterota bacterium]
MLTLPTDAHLTLKGPSEAAGYAPLDLPHLWNGRYSVVIEGGGCSRTQGVLFIPSRGGMPYALSEPPGLSTGLVIRSLSFPGVPAISSGHVPRGIVLSAAATGAAFAGIRAHHFYRRAVNDDDSEAQDRVDVYRGSRDRWAGYLGAVWGLSALDYWIHPRMAVIESQPHKVTLSAPSVTRGSVVWRSILVPGAGQEFANRRGRGLFWISSVLATGAAAVISDQAHRLAVHRLERAQADLAADTTGSQSLIKEVDRRANRVQTTKDARAGFLGATIGLYALNVIDAAVVSLGRGGGKAPAEVSAVTRISPASSEVALRLRF